jgi:integrase/recombinase XerC
MNEPFFKRSHKAWYINKGGKQVRLARDKAEAWAKLSALDQQQTITPDSLGAMIDKYLEWVQANKSKATYDSYGRYLRSWRELHGHLPVTSIRGHHVEELTVKRCAKKSNGEKFSDSAKWQCKKSAVVFFAWLKSQGLIDVNPLQGYKKGVTFGVRRNHISREQFDKLLDCCDDPAFRDLLTVMWETGCRPAEIFQATGKHFSREKRTITLRKADGDWVKSKKAGYVRVVYLSEAAYAIVCRLADQFGDGLLFSNKGKRWSISSGLQRLKTMQKRCGVKSGMYMYRHSYAHRKASEGMPILVLAELMATSIKMLESVYAHIGDNHALLLKMAG